MYNFILFSAENFQFYEAEEIQSAYFGRKSCTIFPMILHFNKNGVQSQMSCVFISDTKQHGAVEVYGFLHTLNEFLAEKFPERKYMIYMSGMYLQAQQIVQIYQSIIILF